MLGGGAKTEDSQEEGKPQLKRDARNLLIPGHLLSLLEAGKRPAK